MASPSGGELLVAVLCAYRAAAVVIEAAAIDQTIIRPAWLTDADEVDYETTRRDETFKGAEVSRRRVAVLVTDVIADADRTPGPTSA